MRSQLEERNRVHSAQQIVSLVILFLCCCCAQCPRSMHGSAALECLTPEGQILFNQPINVVAVSEPTAGDGGSWSINLSISDESAEEIARLRSDLKDNNARVCIQGGPKSLLARYLNAGNYPVLGAQFSSRDAAAQFKKQLRLMAPPD